MSIKIRDQRRQPWFWVDEKMIKRDGAALGPTAIAVYCLIAAYADNKTQKARPGIATLAKKLGISPTTVREGIAKLEKNKWIYVQREYDPIRKVHKAHEYTMLDAPTTASVVVPTRRKATTESGTELDSLNQPHKDSPAPKRKANPEFDAICVVCHIDQDKIPTSASHIGKQVRQLKEVGWTAQDILDYHAWRQSQSKGKAFLPTLVEDMATKDWQDARRLSQASAMIDTDLIASEAFARYSGE